MISVGSLVQVQSGPPFFGIDDSLDSTNGTSTSVIIALNNLFFDISREVTLGEPHHNHGESLK